MVNRSVEMKNPNTPVLSRVNHKKIFFGERLQLPGSKCTGKYDDGTQQQHHYGDTVYFLQSNRCEAGHTSTMLSVKSISSL